MRFTNTSANSAKKQRSDSVLISFEILKICYALASNMRSRELSTNVWQSANTSHKKAATYTDELPKQLVWTTTN